MGISRKRTDTRKQFHPSPQTQRTTAALSGLIDERLAAGSRFLPSLRELTTRLGASRTTVYKALKLLEAEGTISLVPRRGIQITRAMQTDMPPLVAGTRAREAPSPQPLPRWKDVRNRLAAELSTLTFPTGSMLPSTKELCSRYGTCYRVLAKSLRALVDEGVLERFRTGYRVRRTRKPGTANAIVLFQVCSDPAGVEYNQLHAEEYWRCLEDECARLGLHLHVRLLRWPEPGEDFHVMVNQATREAEAAFAVAGYIVPTTGCPLPMFAPLLQTIAALGKPAAVLDGTEIDLREVWRSYPAARVFPLGCGALPGEVVGRYLLELGHRKVAFFAPHYRRYVRNDRLKGFTDVYAAGGLDDGVHCFSRPTTAGNTDEVEHSSHYSVFKEKLAADARELVRQFGLHDAHQQYVSRSAQFFARLQFRLVPNREMFAEALAHSDITTWVAYNDHLAFGALDFLAEQGVPAPKRISVVGFDDTPEALARGLTSYNLNIPAIMHAAVEYILAPATERRRRHVVVEIPGRVMERSSSRERGRA